MEKDLTAGDIADQFDMSKPSISHHLSILKKCGISTVGKEGAANYILIKYNCTSRYYEMVFDVTKRGDENEVE